MLYLVNIGKQGYDLSQSVLQIEKRIGQSQFISRAHIQVQSLDHTVPQILSCMAPGLKNIYVYICTHIYFYIYIRKKKRKYAEMDASSPFYFQHSELFCIYGTILYFCSKVTFCLQECVQGVLVSSVVCVFISVCRSDRLLLFGFVLPGSRVAEVLTETGTMV